VRGEEIQAELAKGWSAAAAIWKVLTKNKEITCSVIIPIPTCSGRLRSASRGWSRPTVSDTSTWHCFLKINPSPRARFPSSGSDAKRIFHAECLTLRSAVRRRRPEARPSFASRVKTPYNRSFNGKENKARSSIGFPAESEAARLRSLG